MNGMHFVRGFAVFQWKSSAVLSWVNGSIRAVGCVMIFGICLGTLVESMKSIRSIVLCVGLNVNSEGSI